MTGRAAGYCAGYPTPGFANPYGGRGFWGWGAGRRGGGRGRRNWFYATGVPGWQRTGMGLPAFGRSGPVPPPVYPAPAAYPLPAQGYTPSIEQELEFLKGQAEYFEDALAGIKQRIEELLAKGQDKQTT